MSTSTDDTHYVDDPDATQATDPNVGLTIEVKKDGSVTVTNHTSGQFTDITNGGPQPQVPTGAQFRSAYVVFTRNPTCVRCRHGGQWKEICF